MAIETIEKIEEPLRTITSGVNWKKYFFEFLSMFFAVILAFALNSWNDNRKTKNVELNILREISNGLELDSEDVSLNALGHQKGLEAARYFRVLLQGGLVAEDSIASHRRILVRDFISIQNTSGYESLKSQGLNVISNDKLRTEIISLYEYNYKLVEKIEEQYAAQQFFGVYSDRFNRAISSSLIYANSGEIERVKTPLIIPPEELSRLLLDLSTIEGDRRFTLKFYQKISAQIEKVKGLIDKELGKNTERI